MSSAAIGDFGQALQHAQVESTGRTEAEASRNAGRAEAHLAIQELEALREVDMVAPPEVADIAEPLVDMYRGTLTSGDHLRLDRRTQHSAPALWSAVGRILDVDTTGVAGDQDAIFKEAKMRRALQALESVTADLSRRAALNVKD